MKDCEVVVEESRGSKHTSEPEPFQLKKVDGNGFVVEDKVHVLTHICRKGHGDLFIHCIS